MAKIQGDGSLQSLRRIFNTLTFLGLRDKGLPVDFNDIKIVNVYEAHGIQGDSWEQYLKNQGQAWIITPLHYFNDSVSKNYVRIASGGGRWDSRNKQMKYHEDTYWYERKYSLVGRNNKPQDAMEGAGVQNYTMFEYSPHEDKPKHALCRITVDNNNNAHDRPLSISQQRKGKEIDHANRGHKGGNLENSSMYHNLKILEETLRELRSDFSDADILEVFSRIKSENIPAEIPYEHSTAPPVSNPRKRGCTDMNTSQAGTSTQWTEQDKVEMFQSNFYGEKPTNFRPNNNISCSAFGEPCSHHGNFKIAKPNPSLRNDATTESGIFDGDNLLVDWPDVIDWSTYNLDAKLNISGGLENI